MICNYCGTWNDDGDDICKKCGKLLASSSGVSSLLSGNSVETNNVKKTRKKRTGFRYIKTIFLSALLLGFVYAVIGSIFITDEKVSVSESNREYETVNVSKLRLEGGWNDIESGGTYWEFEDGEYWWYKSYENLDDNYWYGTTNIINGLEGIKAAKLNVEGMQEYIDNGVIAEDDIYTIICTPLKVISDGVDKSAENIPEGQTLTYVWILVDYGEEGVVAQTLNVANSDTRYYKKIK